MISNLCLINLRMTSWTMSKVSCEHQLKVVPKMDFELKFLDLMTWSLKYNNVLQSLKGKNQSRDKHLDSCYNPFRLWKTHHNILRDIFPECLRNWKWHVQPSNLAIALGKERSHLLFNEFQLFSISNVHAWTFV